MTLTQWPLEPLGNVCRIDAPIVDPKLPEYCDLPHVNGENIESGTGKLLPTKSASEDGMTSGKYLFDAGVVLYSKLRPYLRKVTVADFRGVCSADMYPLVFNRDLVDLNFAKFCLLSEQFTEYAVEASARARMPKLNREQLLAYEFPIPSLAEQEQIAAELTAGMQLADKAKRIAFERCEAAEALSSSFYRDAFGDAPLFVASPLVPSEPTQHAWTWHRLTDLARLATGHTPSRRCSAYWNGDIPWIQLPDIRALDGKCALETSEYTNELGIANSAAVLLPAGTVCLSRTASVGFVTVMGKPMATSQDFVNWVCGPELDAEFLMHLLIRCRSAIRELGSGAVHHTIYFPTVETFAVCIPPVIEQRRIVESLSANLQKAQVLATRCREELAAIESLPMSLLRSAFERHGADG